MRNFKETNTHIQCCASRCKKIMKKTKKDKNFSEAMDSLMGCIFSKLCKKHSKEMRERHFKKEKLIEKIHTSQNKEEKVIVDSDRSL